MKLFRAHGGYHHRPLCSSIVACRRRCGGHGVDDQLTRGELAGRHRKMAARFRSSVCWLEVCRKTSPFVASGREVWRSDGRRRSPGIQSRGHDRRRVPGLESRARRKRGFLVARLRRCAEAQRQLVIAPESRQSFDSVRSADGGNGDLIECGRRLGVQPVSRARPDIAPALWSQYDATAALLGALPSCDQFDFRNVTGSLASFGMLN